MVLFKERFLYWFVKRLMVANSATQLISLIQFP